MRIGRLTLAATFLIGSVGCSQLQTRDTAAAVPPEGAAGQAVKGDPTALKPSADAVAFQRVQNAAQLNAAVLYFEGDTGGPKLVKLPENGQPIYLSTLLEQIGASDKFGKLDVSVSRVTPEAPSGAKLAVRFKRKGNVDPLTDYAILPGDRITIREAASDWLMGLF